MHPELINSILNKDDNRVSKLEQQVRELQEQNRAILEHLHELIQIVMANDDQE